jgi:uncharacterized protein (TIGR00369 family)
MSRAHLFEPLVETEGERWLRYGRWEREYFAAMLGITVEEVKRDYCRMRMPFRSSLEQPAGVVHGGAIASLIDSVVVPAIGSAYDAEVAYATIDLHVQFLAGLRQEDAIAEGWIVQRGRSIVFVEAEVVGEATGAVVARGQMTYKVSHPK